MKKYIFLLASILFLNNCANLEFVLKPNKGVNVLTNNTNLSISGDEAGTIHGYIANILGNTYNENFIYKLSINSKRTDLAQIIEKDATASKFSIEYNVIYNLYNIKENCKILKKEISTKSSYDSKSAGYSFGTDLSEKETRFIIISKNIDQFILSVNRYDDLNDCL